MRFLMIEREGVGNELLVRSGQATDLDRVIRRAVAVVDRDDPFAGACLVEELCEEPIVLGEERVAAGRAFRVENVVAHGANERPAEGGVSH